MVVAAQAAQALDILLLQPVQVYSARKIRHLHRYYQEEVQEASLKAYEAQIGMAWAEKLVDSVEKAFEGFSRLRIEVLGLLDGY